MSPTMEMRREGATVVLEINRPDDHNRIDMVTMDAMIAAIEDVDRDRSVRSLVITGRGQYFCAGGQIGGYPVGQVQDQLDYARSFVELQERIGRARVPVIAAVNGFCLAGGSACSRPAISQSQSTQRNSRFLRSKGGCFRCWRWRWHGEVCRRRLPLISTILADA